MVAHADPLAPARAGAAPVIVRVWDGGVQDNIVAWQPALDVRSCAPMDGPVGSAVLGAERRVGSLLRAGGPDFLGLGSWRRCL
jgi:hypothetical protein